MAEKESKHPVIVLEIVMLGKTGKGKSATGNSLLQWKAFKTSFDFESVTQEVTSEYGKYKYYVIKVIDTPGVADTELSELEDKKKAVHKMTDMFFHCEIGVHVFLLVVRLGVKLTVEEKEVFMTYKKIFGERYLKNHGIVVLTHGDYFKQKMEEKGLTMTFEEWIKQRNRTYFGCLFELLEECDFRCVLFDNRTEDVDVKELQLQKFFESAEPLRRKGIYTSDTFQKFDQQRKRLILEHKLPIVKASILQKIGLIRSDLEVLAKKSALDDVKKIKKDTVDLLEEIKKEDEGTSLLKNLQRNVEDILDRCRDIKEAIKDNKTEEFEKRMDELKAKSQLLKEHQESASSFWHSWIGVGIKTLTPTMLGAGLASAALMTGGLAGVAAGVAAISGVGMAVGAYGSGKAVKEIKKGSLN